MAQAEGAAHGKHKVADFHPIAIAHGRGEQIGRFDGQHADVGLFIIQYPLRMKSPAVGQIDANAVGRGIAKDVPVGEHVEVVLPLDNHAGAGFLDMPIAIVPRVCCGTSASIWTTVGPMSFATVLSTVAWASSTGAFCSRIRCNWARASGDVTGLLDAGRPEFRSTDRPDAQPREAQQEGYACAGLSRTTRRPTFRHRPRLGHQDTSNSMSLIDRSESPLEESSNRLQSTSAELPPLAPCRSASRWHLMQYVA